MYLPFIIVCSRQRKLLISQNKMLTDTDDEWTSIWKFNLAWRNWGGGCKIICKPNRFDSRSKFTVPIIKLKKMSKHRI